MKQYLVLDVGGSAIKIALMDEEAHIIKRDTAPTPLDNKEHYYAVLESIITPYIGQIEGIALSAPGIIDAESGYAYTGGALTFFEGVPFAQELEAMFHLPVSVGNDAKCAAMAEVGYGNLMDIDDAIALILGTGIGGAIIKNRQIHQGKHFSAGEFSFIFSNYEKLSLEASFANINGSIGLQRAVEESYGVSGLSGKEIFALANEGNQEVRQGIALFAKNLATHIYNLQTIYDPECFVIGGGISAQPLLFSLIQEALDHIYTAIPIAIPQAQIRACKFGNDANLIGALYIHKSQHTS